MGLNDLQSQINRLASKTSRQEDIIRDLQTKVATAEQHAATTQQNLNSWAGAGGGGGGGNAVQMAKLTTSALMPSFSDDPVEGEATLQTPQDDGTIDDGAATVGVFAYPLYSKYFYKESRVYVVKDDNYTTYKEGSGKDWYQVIGFLDSPVIVRVINSDSDTTKSLPHIEAAGENYIPTPLGQNASLRVYTNTDVTAEGYRTPEGTANYVLGQSVWEVDDPDNTEEFDSTTKWATRFRTGGVPNGKDLYHATFYPYQDLIIVEDVACIMAYVQAQTHGYDDQPPTGSVGVMRYNDISSSDTGDYGMGWWYPMGKRRNIIGQFTADTDAGDTSSFLLGRWDGGTPVNGGAAAQDRDFEKERPYGLKAPYSGTSSVGYWDCVQFAAGQVYNAMNFTIKGHADFGDVDDADIVACQYDEERGVYLAAPLRCTED